MGGGGDDSLSASITLPTAFNFYGTSEATVKVSSNGFVGFPGLTAGSGDYGTSGSWNTKGPLIAAGWHDLNTTPNFAPATAYYGGTSNIGATTYSNSYSLTAPSAYSYNSPNNFQRNFGYQISLFTGPQTVTLGNGDTFDFNAGDIAVSYIAYANATNNNNGFAGDTFAVGVTNGTVLASTPAIIDNTTESLDPGYYASPSAPGSNATPDYNAFPSGESFLLYRYNGTGYDSTVATFVAAPIPEPASLGMLALGGFGLLARRRRA